MKLLLIPFLLLSGCAGYSIKFGGAYEEDGRRIEATTEVVRLDPSFAKEKK